jgi:hypothetical protein
MGNTFGKIMVKTFHFPKKPGYLEKKLDLLMEKSGYRPIREDEDPDEGVAIYWRPETKGLWHWLLLHCDLWEGIAPDELRDIAWTLVETLAEGSMVVGVSCEDSDHLIFTFTENANYTYDRVVARGMGSDIDPAMAKIWELYSFDLGSSPEDRDKARDLFNQDIVFEGDLLIPLGEILGIDGSEFSYSPYECASMEGFQSRTYIQDLEYCRAMDKTVRRLPNFIFGANTPIYGSMIDRRSILFLENEGGKGRGVGLIFTGPFVKHDQMWMDSAGIRLRDGWDDGHLFAQEREKILLDDGRPAYRILFPDFVFPEGAPLHDPVLAPKGRLESKGHHRNYVKAIEISFVLRGDAECQKSGTIMVYPMENPDNVVSVTLNEFMFFPIYPTRTDYELKLINDDPELLAILNEKFPEFLEIFRTSQGDLDAIITYMQKFSESELKDMINFSEKRRRWDDPNDF